MNFCLNNNLIINQYVVSTVCQMLENGIFAMIGVMDFSPTVSSILSFSRDFNIPLVMSSLSSSPPVFLDRQQRHQHQQHDDEMMLTPTSRIDDVIEFTTFVRPDVSRAIVALCRHFRWTMFYYVYDSDDGKILILIVFPSITHINSRYSYVKY